MVTVVPRGVVSFISFLAGFSAHPTLPSVNMPTASSAQTTRRTRFVFVIFFNTSCSKIFGTLLLEQKSGHSLFPCCQCPVYASAVSSSSSSYRRRRKPKSYSSNRRPSAIQNSPQIIGFGMAVDPMPPKKRTIAAMTVVPSLGDLWVVNVIPCVTRCYGFADCMSRRHLAAQRLLLTHWWRLGQWQDA